MTTFRRPQGPPSSSPSERLSRCVIAAAMILGLAAGTLAAAPASLPDPRADGLTGGERLSALIDRIKLEQGRVETLSARFVQRQENDFLLEPEESSGRFFYAAPDQVRWEYVRPKPITLLISPGSMITWYHDLERAEQMEVGRYSDRVLKYLGASGSLSTLLEYFEVAAAFPNDPAQPYRLEMTPRFERIAKRLRSMTIWIDPQLFVPARLRYEGGDGSITDFRFQDVEINAPLPAGHFELELPDEVDVRRVDLGG